MSDSQTSALPTLVSAALVVLARMGITGYESAMHFHTSVALFMLVPLFGILFPAFPSGKLMLTRSSSAQMPTART